MSKKVSRGRKMTPCMHLAFCPFYYITFFSCAVWCPQCEAVSQQLHDEGAVFVQVFIQCVKLCNSLIKSRFSQCAGQFLVIEDLIVEHRKVKSQPQPDGVCGLHLFLAYIESLLVSSLGIIYYLLPIITTSNFSKVPEVISLHFQTEDLTLWISCIGY